jgi:hypothetical protein
MSESTKLRAMLGWRQASGGKTPTNGDNHALEAALLLRSLPHALARLGAGGGGPFIQGCDMLAAAARLAFRNSPFSR